MSDRENGESREDFLSEEIRAVCGLLPSTPITPELLEEKLDEVDRNATSLDPGYRRRHPRMKLLTHKEVSERLERVRTAQF